MLPGRRAVSLIVGEIIAVTWWSVTQIAHSMSNSLRKNFGKIAILIFFVLIGFAGFRLYHFYNHEIARFDLGDGYSIRIWSFGTSDVRHGTWSWTRHVDWSVSNNGKIWPTKRSPFFFDHAKDLRKLTSKNGQFICIYSPDNPEVVILCDLSNHEFFTHYRFSDFPPNDPYRAQWEKALNEMRDEFPSLPVDKILDGFPN